MREVAVHLEHELGAVGERAAEAGDVGGAEPLLRGAVEDADVRQLGGEPVGELAGAVGRVVVDHEHAVALAEDAAERADHRLEVLELVVGGEADGRAHQAGDGKCGERGGAYDRRGGQGAAQNAQLPRNGELAAQFELLADLMELEGADGFRIAAYRRAADPDPRDRELGRPARARRAARRSCRGSARRSSRRSSRSVEDGEIHALTKRKAEVPAEVATFMRLPGLGPKTARRLWKELGITTVDELRAAAEAQQLRDLGGLGAEVGGEDPRRARQAARGRGAAGGRCSARCSRGFARSRRTLAAHPAAVQVSIAGSARRFRETVRDLDLIATATDAPALIDAFCELPWVVEVAARGDTKATVVGQDGLRFDLRVVPPESYGNLLQHFTGSKDHNVALREAAVRRGLSVSEYGITEVETRRRCTRSRPRRRCTRSSATSGSRPSCARTAASSRRRAPGALPDLVELGDLRGDLHTHTTWSDGKDTLEAMVAEAIAPRLRLLRDLRPLPPAPRRPARAAGGGDRRAERARCRSSS